MEIYFGILVILVIAYLIYLFVIGEIKEAWGRLGNISRLVQFGPFLLSFVGLGVWTMIEREVWAISPLLISMLWVIVATTTVNRFIPKQVIGRRVF